MLVRGLKHRNALRNALLVRFNLHNRDPFYSSFH
jgi:hypothetical protein